MPVYQYECRRCGEFEETCPMSKPRRQRCPKCRCKVDRIYSPVGIKFVGTGFYVNDYKNRTQPKERKIASVKEDRRVSQPPGESPRWAQD